MRSSAQVGTGGQFRDYRSTRTFDCSRRCWRWCNTIANRSYANGIGMTGNSLLYSWDYFIYSTFPIDEDDDDINWIRDDLMMMICSQRPRLFVGCQFYLCNHAYESPLPTRDVLRRLIELGGGKLLSREPCYDLWLSTNPTLPYYSSWWTSTQNTFLHFLQMDDSKLAYLWCMYQASDCRRNLMPINALQWLHRFGCWIVLDDSSCVHLTRIEFINFSDDWLPF